MALKDIRKNRIKKLERMLKRGQNPYPIHSQRTHTINEALADFDSLASKKQEIVIAGRIRAVREHGGSTFLHIEDGTGRMQVYLKQDVLETNYHLFLDNFDIGDFLEAKGALFITKRGEKTLGVAEFCMLAKSILPLPEKWHGLKDAEERFRKRYLDLLMNPEVKEKLSLRIKIIAELRKILESRGFSEVETPILQPLPGGALAKPFKTHLNALNMDLYLRISPELYLKRLLVGGFEKIYEIGRCFRNEGMDWSHNPDFTMLELYWAYQERDGLMKLVEDMLQQLTRTIKAKGAFFYRGQELDFQRPWQKKTFRDLMKQHASVDVDSAKGAELRKKIKELGIKVGKETDRAALLDELYKKTVLPKIVQPTFVLNHPVEMSILAKAQEDHPIYAHRFQLVVVGLELVNGFSELNDPTEQRKRFEKSKMVPERKDEDFLEALEYGMPPAAGFGMGIDRLVALLTDSHNLREIIFFPTMKSKQ